MPTPLTFMCIEFTPEQRDFVLSNNSGIDHLSPWEATNGKFYIAERVALTQRHSTEIIALAESLPRVQRNTITPVTHAEELEI